jgi:hypothetical protein
VFQKLRRCNAVRSPRKRGTCLANKENKHTCPKSLNFWDGISLGEVWLDGLELQWSDPCL